MTVAPSPRTSWVTCSARREGWARTGAAATAASTIVTPWRPWPSSRGRASRRGWCRPGRRTSRTRHTDSPRTHAPPGRRSGRAWRRVRGGPACRWWPSVWDRVALDLGDEGGPGDAQFLGRPGAVAFVVLQRLLNMHPFDLVHGQRGVATVERAGPVPEFARQVLGPDRPRPARQQEGPLQDVAGLEEVPGPRVGEQPLQRVIGQDPRGAW